MGDPGLREGTIRKVRTVIHPTVQLKKSMAVGTNWVLIMLDTVRMPPLNWKDPWSHSRVCLYSFSQVYLTLSRSHLKSLMRDPKKCNMVWWWW